MTSRKFITATIALGAGLFLSACGDSGESSPQTVTETETATTTATAEDTATAGETTSGTTAADQPSGDDPVFSAIDAALADYSDGIIVSVDREDDSDTFDIDLIQGEEVIELKVDADGTVREDERERERGDDDLARAQSATVTAEEAIRQALDENPEGVLDDAELEEEDGDLRWEISLDDADRRDLTEVSIPAN